MYSRRFWFAGLGGTSSHPGKIIACGILCGDGICKGDHHNLPVAQSLRSLWTKQSQISRRAGQVKFRFEDVDGGIRIRGRRGSVTAQNAIENVMYVPENQRTKNPARC